MGTINALNTESDSPAGIRHRAAPPTIELVRKSAKPAGGSLEARVYRSWSAADEILPAWNEILALNERLSIFSTPEWLRSWWDAFGANRKLIIVAFADPSGSVLGIVPLYREMTKYPFFQMPQLKLVGDGSGDSDKLDMVVRPGREPQCVAALVKWIAAEGNSGICTFNTLREESECARLIENQLIAQDWPLQKTSSVSSVISFPSSWESYIQGLSPNFRRLIRRSKRHLECRFDLRFHRCECSDELPGMLDNLYRLHQRRWNLVHEPGTFVSTERRDLYAHATKAFLERGWLELWELLVDGKPAASQFAFRYGHTVYGLQEGFDVDLFRFQVGHVLRAEMFESFINQGVKRYDFLGGFSKHKQRWGAERGSYTNLQFAAPRSLAGCLLAVDKGRSSGKKWLRQHLPSYAWHVLHVMNVSLFHPQNGKTPLLDQSAANPNEEEFEGAPVQ